ncbi:hypothetical protein AC1031_009541 [Aphanomyces cochlioides]|nr:hypothetical protein AC1031_009541 [Aphanomyces cochlioides]
MGRHFLFCAMSAEPVSPNFFHCPPLSRDAQQRFQDLGVAAAYELAENAQLCGGPIHWELESNEDGLKLFKGKVAGTKYESFPATPRLSTIQVLGAMPEVFDLFRSQTTEESKEESFTGQVRVRSRVQVTAIAKP